MKVGKILQVHFYLIAIMMLSLSFSSCFSSGGDVPPSAKDELLENLAPSIDAVTSMVEGVTDEDSSDDVSVYNFVDGDETKSVTITSNPDGSTTVEITSTGGQETTDGITIQTDSEEEILYNTDGSVEISSTITVISHPGEPEESTTVFEYDITVASDGTLTGNVSVDGGDPIEIDTFLSAKDDQTDELIKKIILKAEEIIFDALSVDPTYGSWDGTSPGAFIGTNYGVLYSEDSSENLIFQVAFTGDFTVSVDGTDYTLTSPTGASLMVQCDSEENHYSGLVRIDNIDQIIDFKEDAEEAGSSEEILTQDLIKTMIVSIENTVKTELMGDTDFQTWTGDSPGTYNGTNYSTVYSVNPSGELVFNITFSNYVFDSGSKQYTLKTPEGMTTTVTYPALPDNPVIYQVNIIVDDGDAMGFTFTSDDLAGGALDQETVETILVDIQDAIMPALMADTDFQSWDQSGPGTFTGTNYAIVYTLDGSSNLVLNITFTGYIHSAEGNQYTVTTPEGSPIGITVHAHPSTTTDYLGSVVVNDGSTSETYTIDFSLTSSSSVPSLQTIISDIEGTIKSELMADPSFQTWDGSSPGTYTGTSYSLVYSASGPGNLVFDITFAGYIYSLGDYSCTLTSGVGTTVMVTYNAHPSTMVDYSGSIIVNDGVTTETENIDFSIDASAGGK